MTPLESDGEARGPSLRVRVNCRFRSHLGCLEQKVTIFQAFPGIA